MKLAIIDSHGIAVRITEAADAGDVEHMEGFEVVAAAPDVAAGWRWDGASWHGPVAYAVVDGDGLVINMALSAAPETLARPEGGAVELAPAGVGIGWQFAGGGWIAPEGSEPPPPTEAEFKAGLIAYAADKRWRVETGGVTVGGVALDTSRASQAMISAAYAWSRANPAEPIVFKAASGWVTLDAAAMAATASAVGAHVQACFATEAAVSADIEAGGITTTGEIDAAGWPG